MIADAIATYKAWTGTKATDLENCLAALTASALKTIIKTGGQALLALIVGTAGQFLCKESLKQESDCAIKIESCSVLRDLF